MAFYRKIDFSKPECIEEIKVKQQDSNSRLICFELTDEFAPFDLTGKTVLFAAKRKGDKCLFLSECDIEGNRASVILSGNMLKNNDILVCELSVIGEDYAISSPPFIVNAGRLIRDDEYIEGKDDFSAFEKAMQSAMKLPDPKVADELMKRLETVLESVDGNNLIDNAVGINKTSFFAYERSPKTEYVFNGQYQYGYTVVLSDGRVIESRGDNASDFIEVEGGGEYLLSSADVNCFGCDVGVCWYDGEKEFEGSLIINANIPSERKIYAPPTARYMRFSVSSLEGLDLSRIVVIKLNNGAVIEEGFIPDYVPYSENVTVSITDAALSEMFEERDNCVVAAANDYTDLCLSMEIDGAKLKNGSVTAEKLAEYSENPCDYPGNEISMFDIGICCGDSLTMGWFDYKDSAGKLQKHINEPCCYPAVLKRLSGLDSLVALGKGGVTIKEWYDRLSSIGGRFDGLKLKFVIIFLGINDGLRNGWTAESAEYYTKIVNKIKGDVPKIKIFAVVPPEYFNGEKHGEVAEGIRAKAAELGLYLIDLRKYWTECNLENYADCSFAEGFHFHSYGHYKLAKTLKSYISYIIKNNPDDFKDIQFIGTDFSFKGSALDRGAE